jgi:transcriptional regulator with XRE-family HTH domain
MVRNQKRIKKILVKNIKECRKLSGLTQEQAAEKAGITYKYWQRLEMTSQVDLPSLPVLFKISKALKTPPSKLLQF